MLSENTIHKVGRIGQIVRDRPSLYVKGAPLRKQSDPLRKRCKEVN